MNLYTGGQNKDDLLEMIQHGAKEIIQSKERLVLPITSLSSPLAESFIGSMTVEDDIDKIIRDGEERTAALQKKYEGMGLDALANYQPNVGGARQWEGQDFGGPKVRIASTRHRQHS